MKKFLLTAALACLCPIGSLTAASIVLTIAPNGGVNGGGEFQAVTSDNGNFLTFCLEDHEYFYPGHTYTYQLSGAAIAGGPNHDSSTPGIDIISQGTALLYSQFATGVLPNYFNANRTANAANLQLAIWGLEDELSGADQEAAAGGLANPYVKLVVDTYGSWASAQANYSGSAVKVVNVYDLTGSDGLSGVNRQDQLIYVPDGGATIALLGMGLSGLALVPRRFRRC